MIDEGHHPQVTHGLITGIHSPQQSHYRLLRSVVDADTLAGATKHALRAGLVEHEEGDATLFLPGTLAHSASAMWT